MQNPVNAISKRRRGILSAHVGGTCSIDGRVESGGFKEPLKDKLT
jgi:hypothetical protein